MDFTGSGWKETTSISEGGGITYDLAPHLMDQAIRLFGPIDGAHGELDSHTPKRVNDDDWFASLNHASGVRTRLWMNKCHDLSRLRFRIVGSKGTFKSYGLDLQEAQLANGQLPNSSDYGIHPAYPNVTLDTGEKKTIPKLAGGYQDFYELLAESIDTRERAP